MQLSLAFSIVSCSFLSSELPATSFSFGPWASISKPQNVSVHLSLSIPIYLRPYPYFSSFRYVCEINSQKCNFRLFCLMQNPSLLFAVLPQLSLSKSTTVDINPSLAFSINLQFSLSNSSFLHSSLAFSILFYFPSSSSRFLNPSLAFSICLQLSPAHLLLFLPRSSFLHLSLAVSVPIHHQLLSIFLHFFQLSLTIPSCLHQYLAFSIYPQISLYISSILIQPLTFFTALQLLHHLQFSSFIPSLLSISNFYPSLACSIHLQLAP